MAYELVVIVIKAVFYLALLLIGVTFAAFLIVAIVYLAIIAMVLLAVATIIKALCSLLTLIIWDPEEDSSRTQSQHQRVTYVHHIVHIELNNDAIDFPRQMSATQGRQALTFDGRDDAQSILNTHSWTSNPPPIYTEN